MNTNNINEITYLWSEESTNQTLIKYKSTLYVGAYSNDGIFSVHSLSSLQLQLNRVQLHTKKGLANGPDI